MKTIKLFPSLFGVGKINPDEYNKTDFIDIIEEEYKLNSTNAPIFKDTYTVKQSYNTFGVSLPFPPDLESSLTNLYKIEVEKFLKENEIKNSYKIKMLNVVAMKDGQGLDKHWHQYSDFVLVHYLQVPNVGKITFYNPSAFVQWNIRSRNFWDWNNLNHSGGVPRWTMETQNDSYIIFPSNIEHEVPTVKSNPEDPLRISISTSIILD